MVVHQLKVHPQFWPSIKDGSKPFEVRRNDRHFRVGDACVLQEWSPEHGYMQSGEEVRIITYMLRNEDFPLGVPVGYVVLGFGIAQEANDG